MTLCWRRNGPARIRFDEENEHRFDAIQEAGDRYDRNRSDAVALACDDMARLAGVFEEFLGRDDLARDQQRGLIDARDRALSLEANIEREIEMR